MTVKAVFLKRPFFILYFGELNAFYTFVELLRRVRNFTEKLVLLQNEILERLVSACLTADRAETSLVIFDETKLP